MSRVSGGVSGSERRMRRWRSGLMSAPAGHALLLPLVPLDSRMMAA